LQPPSLAPAAASPPCIAVCAGKAEGTKYTAEQLPEGVVTKGGSSWTKDWLKFDNSYFTEVW